MTSSRLIRRITRPTTQRPVTNTRTRRNPQPPLCGGHVDRHFDRRRGATMVEFAVTLPIVLLLFFAAFEFCRAAMIRHTMDNAVYEACRVGIIPGAEEKDVRDEARRILATVGINNADVRLTPGKLDRDTPEITVAVSVPLDDNTFVPPQFLGGATLTRQLTLRREGIQ